MSDIEMGDLVRLLSGGPIMTVKKVTNSVVLGTLVETIWFDNNGTLQTNTFSLDFLTKVEK